MKNAIVTLERRNGKTVQVCNNAADDYRMNQMRERGWMPAGELCCRLGIPLIGSELTELRITENKSRGCEMSEIDESSKQLVSRSGAFEVVQILENNNRLRTVRRGELLRSFQTFDEAYNFRTSHEECIESITGVFPMLGIACPEGSN